MFFSFFSSSSSSSSSALVFSQKWLRTSFLLQNSLSKKKEISFIFALEQEKERDNSTASYLNFVYLWFYTSL